MNKFLIRASRPHWPSLFVSSSWATPMTSMAISIDVTNFRPGPRQWPQWRCCRRGRCRRGPKIVNFYRTEGCRTKIWRRISPGFHWYHQKLSSYVVRRLATSRDVPDFRPIRGREIILHTQIHRYTDTYTENRHTVRPCSPSSACKNVYLIILPFSIYLFARNKIQKCYKNIRSIISNISKGLKLFRT